MSGKRSLIPLEKIRLPPGMQLPEIIVRDRVAQTPDTFGEEINLPDRKQGYYKISGMGFCHNSTVSSATSQRFQDMFYRTDWPSLSDTGTDSPDFLELEGSDSSASSMFSWADNEGTKLVAEEWEKVQRTLYNEDGHKVTQKHLIDECNQWKEMFPHLRVIGRSCGDLRIEDDNSYDTEEEVLALHYDTDKEDDDHIKSFFKKQNGPLTPGGDCQKLMPLRANIKSLNENSTKKYSNSIMKKKTSAVSLVEELDSFLHITPLNKIAVQSELQKQRIGPSSLIKSEISSSRWQHRNTSSPDFVSLPFQLGENSIKQTHRTRDSSATSLYSSISKKINKTEDFNNIQTNNMWKKSPSSISASRKYNNFNERSAQVLDPIETTSKSRIVTTRSVSISQINDSLLKTSAHINRNISLPPIQSDENKGRRKVTDFTSSGKSYLRKKKTLEPINHIPNTIPKQNIEMNSPLIDTTLTHSKSSRNKKKGAKKNRK